MRIRVFDADLTTIMRGVEAGTLDMGVGIFKTAPGIRRVRFFRFSFIFIRPGGDATAARTSVTWSAAAAGTLIVLPSASPVQQVIDRHLPPARRHATP